MEYSNYFFNLDSRVEICLRSDPISSFVCPCNSPIDNLQKKYINQFIDPHIQFFIPFKSPSSHSLLFLSSSNHSSHLSMSKPANPIVNASSSTQVSLYGTLYHYSNLSFFQQQSNLTETDAGASKMKSHMQNQTPNKQSSRKDKVE